MAKKQSQAKQDETLEPDSLEEALLPEPELAAEPEPEPEPEPVAEVEAEPGQAGSWLLAQIDAGNGPIGILTNHSRKARAALLELDAACGDRVRTLSLDRARLGVAGVEVKAYSAPEQLRGARLGAAWVQSCASPRMVDLLRRSLQKGAKVFPD
jgi:hypothetical protein